MNDTDYHTLILGGGQAGLATAYYLQKAGISFCILEKNSRLGDSRRQRYDSLCLFSPRFCNHLPGYSLPGKLSGFPTKDEIADYMVSYGNYFAFTVAYDTIVQSVNKSDNLFVVKTTKGVYTAKNVVLATGGFTTPYIPAISETFLSSVMQIHSSDYKNPQTLDMSGSVLVVGNGNSGIQIAQDLLPYGQVGVVYLEKRRWIPKSWFGRWLLEVLGIFGTRSNSRIGNIWKASPEPVIGFERTSFFAQENVVDAGPIISVDGTDVHCKNACITNVTSIVRCTGFTESREIIEIEDVLRDDGSLIHEQGITACSGLYVIGQPWQRTKGSATVGRVGNDARYIVNYIMNKSI